MLYQIGMAESQDHMDQVNLGLHDKESVIRETAVWCLGRLRPPKLKYLVGPLLEDKSLAVRTLARSIYEPLPEPAD